MPEEDNDTAKSQRETAQIRAEIIKGTKEWKQSVAKKLHLKNDGNIITYGWILFMNLFGRQLMSLTIIKLNKGKLVAIGATALMIVYAFNVALLLTYAPYKAKKVNDAELTMLTALFLILWCAIMKDLLENHVDKDLFETMVWRVTVATSVLAVFIFAGVALLPIYQLWDMLSRHLASMKSQDQLINDIYMSTYGKKVKIEEEEEKEAQKAQMDDLFAEAGFKLPRRLRQKFSDVHEGMEWINKSRDCHPSARDRELFKELSQTLRDYQNGKFKARAKEEKFDETQLL